MDRRGFLLAGAAVLAAGCARVLPGEARSTPSASPTAQEPLAVGQDGSPADVVLAALLAGALTAKGRPSTAVAAGSDWQAALGHGDLAALGGNAFTLWSSLSKEDEPPAADKLLGAVADLLAPEIGVLPVPGVDGQLVWRVTTDTADAGVTSLARLAAWSKGKVAAVPSFAVSRADGVPGLRTVYGARFRVTQIDDPLRRASFLADGRVAIAAFRKSDYAGSATLVDLVDTEKLTTADPAVVLVNGALADAEPDHVLALDAVATALTADALVDLQAQVAAGGEVGEVAGRWLRANRLA
jgi:glycine betaine/choline ABC-type transport system substrate-binding protein